MIRTGLNLYLISIVTLTTYNGVLSLKSSNLTEGDKYRFLCWLPIPVKSHQGLFEPLLRTLADRGHHVTLVTPLPMKDPHKNIEQVVIKNQYEIFQPVLLQKGFLFDFLPMTIFMAKTGIKYIKEIYEDPTVKKFLNSQQKFDGLIMELTLANEAFVGLHHKYNAPIIDILPPANYHWTYYLNGIPFDTSYVVEMQTSYTDKMTFTERLLNTLISLIDRLAREFYFMPQMQKQMDKYLRYPGWEDRPPIMDLLTNTSLSLINTHFAISYPYPMPPNAKEIAGINMHSPKPLPKEFQEFMDSSSDGVIIFSMGSHLSMADALDKQKIEWFKQYFGGLKQKVIWKLESTLSDLPSNIKMTNWFPQTDILAHKNCKLFITHGGFHSMMESTYHGVPMVSIPLVTDQGKNSKIIAYHGMGLELALDNITEETISWTINEVLTNKMYKDNALKRSMIYRDTPQNAMETAVFWTEYVIRNKGAHFLRPAIAKMPWYQQAMIDVYFALSVTIIIPLILFYIILKWLFKLCSKLICTSNKIKHE